jgi:maltose alpha-D-glucosyltransferase/alpha-amylase
LPTNHPDVLALRAEMKKVMRFWLDLGADGFRADMASALVKGFGDHRATNEYWHEVRQILRTDYPQAFTVAEWSDPKGALDDAFNACFIHWIPSFNDLYQKESWRSGNGLSDGHSFFDREGKGDVARFLRDYTGPYEATRAKGYVTIPLGNHDIARINNHRTVDELEMIMAFGLTMPGVPFIYYGNEIGMRQLGDNLPQIEGCFKPRAGARTPMQWAAGRNLGFSTADPSHLYLPVDPATDAPNVAAQEGDADSLLNRVRRLIALKHAEPALTAYAEFVPLYAKSNACPFVYARASGNHVLLVLFNPAAKPADAQFRFPIAYRQLERLAGKEIHFTQNGPDLQVELAGGAYAIYRVVK